LTPEPHSAVDGADAVVHLGAKPNVLRSIADPVAPNDVNVNGTINMLEACRSTADPGSMDDLPLVNIPSIEADANTKTAGKAPLGCFKVSGPPPLI
jgi:GDP-mannose 4,6 dehydratase